MKNLLKLILIFFISFDSDASFIESDNDLKDVIKNLKYRNVGPTRGGRVTTVHGVESQKNIFYMGTTGGGVWKTSDFGNNWYNISDDYFKSPSIGAINVYQKDPNIYNNTWYSLLDELDKWPAYSEEGLNDLRRSNLVQVNISYRKQIYPDFYSISPIKCKNA